MNIDLDPYSRNDLKELISWIRDPDELFTWSANTFTFPLDEIQLDKHYQEVHGSDTRLMFKVIESKTRQHIGHVELNRIDRDKRKASISFVLIDPDKRGLGYGQKIVNSILNEGFHPMGLSKIDLFVFEFNTIAIKCYKKAGFEIEQVIKDKLMLNEKFQTLYLMGLNFEKWLSLKKPTK